jgi:beta-mannosidase
VRELSSGWELACAAPDEVGGPGELDQLDWGPAQVPGTAAGALRAAGTWQAGDARDFDAEDWWFRTRFDAEPVRAGEELVLALEGIATVAEVYFNGELLLESDSMFAARAIDITRRARTANELSICCRALAPLLRIARRPRARWRTRLVSEGNLRFFRTMLLGRAPGFAPGPPTVGPWKPIRLERRRLAAVDELELRPRLEPGRGTLRVLARIRELDGAVPIEAAWIELSGHGRADHAELRLQRSAQGVVASGELVADEVEPWWPHTHGAPTLYGTRLLIKSGAEELAIDGGKVGFRSLRASGELEPDGVQLRVNDVPVFARGAVWSPLDLVMPCSSERELRPVLETVLAGGMNMLRVPGIGAYEGDAFYDLADELGILVWQDFMFANLDYPEQDADFMATVEREARGVLRGLGSRPSLAVLCGGSEAAQQVAMLGLDPQLSNGPLYGELLPSLVTEADVDAPYVPSAPWGGDLPFRPNRGIANYYGVGAYLRPLEDARRSEVRFAAECLAFSNVPDDAALESIDRAGGLVPHGPPWKAGVPRDVGAGWDFEDVRDHYLRLLFDLDPVALRSTDPGRYLELSRAVTGEVMSEVFGEWRRERSPCGGGLVLWLTDLMPGAGWGVLDHRGEPKACFHHLRRALAPAAVWSTDEGLGGIVAHVANDWPVPLTATLRVALYRDLELLVEEARCELSLPAHAGCASGVEELLGRFVDVSWAYRFGPPAQDLVVLSLERHGGEGAALVSQSFRLPAGRPTVREPADRLGLRATVRQSGEGIVRLSISSRRLAYGVRVHVPGFVPADDAFSIEPAHERELELLPVGDVPERVSGSISALNLAGRVVISEVVR